MDKIHDLANHDFVDISNHQPIIVIAPTKQAKSVKTIDNTTFIRDISNVAIEQFN